MREKEFVGKREMKAQEKRERGTERRRNQTRQGREMVRERLCSCKRKKNGKRENETTKEEFSRE